MCVLQVTRDPNACGRSCIPKFPSARVWPCFGVIHQDGRRAIPLLPGASSPIVKWVIPSTIRHRRVGAFIISLGLALAMTVTIASPSSAKRQSANWDQQQITNGIRGVDVSQWQHGYSKPLNFKKLRKAGVRFAFIKASDGKSAGDRPAKKWWNIDRRAAKKAKLVVGSYHYGRPTSNVNNLVPDAVGEATQAAARTGRFVSGYLPTALDLESAPANLTPAQVTLWAETWLRTFKTLTGRTPILYSYRYFLANRVLATTELTGYPLWFAHYGTKQAGTTAPIAGWPADAPDFWQFSSRGRLAGSGSTNIDLNVFFGTGDELRRLANMSVATAQQFGLI